MNMKLRKSFLTRAMVACAIVIAGFSCTTEDEFFEQSSPVQESASLFEEEADVTSITLEGIYTEFSESVDCATCTYTVPVDVKTVDGTKLGIKPGSVVCISGKRKAGEIEFVNMIGTEQKPIIIGNCEE